MRRLAFSLRARVLLLLHKTGFMYCPLSPLTILPLSPPAPLTILPKNPEKNTGTLPPDQLSQTSNFFPNVVWTSVLSLSVSLSHALFTQGPTHTLFFSKTGLCTNGSGRAFQLPRTDLITPIRLLIGPYIYSLHTLHSWSLLHMLFNNSGFPFHCQSYI